MKIDILDLEVSKNPIWKSHPWKDHRVRESCGCVRAFFPY